MSPQAAGIAVLILGLLVGALLVLGLLARARQRRALREVELRFRTVIDSLPFDFFMIDESGRYAMQNRALTENWGQNIVGLRPDDMQVDPATLELWKSNNRRAFAGESVTEEVTFKVHGEERVFYNILSPVRSGSKVTGVLGVNIDITARKRAEQETARSREQLRALAARLHEVREEESASIAREIHDEIGQELAALKWGLSRIASKFNGALASGDGTLLRERIDDLNRRIDATFGTVRKIAFQLRPIVLDELGLVGAIEWQLREFQERTGIHCEFEHAGVNEGQLTLAPQHSVAVFRIFQEILTNVLRHAEARQVHVRLRRDHDAAHLEVQDDGRGLPAGEAWRRKGLGILGMQERALVFGGTISIRSEPGEGTRVTVVIPAPRQAPSGQAG